MEENVRGRGGKVLGAGRGWLKETCVFICARLSHLSLELRGLSHEDMHAFASAKHVVQVGEPAVFATLT